VSGGATRRGSPVLPRRDPPAPSRSAAPSRYAVGMTDLVRTDVDGAVATITMDRPDKRNALSFELIDALGSAVEALAGRDDLRVMILAGEGRTFCAGMDLRGVLDDPAHMARMLERLADVGRRIRRLDVPTIARVQGGAIGGGCGLAVVCDFAVTHAEATLGYPEVTLGVCPAVVAPWLIKKIGAGRARAMLLAGGTIKGDEALRIGLCTHLVDRDALETAAADLAATLAGGGRHAIAVTKQWVNELDGSLDDAVLDRAWRLSAEVIAGDEARQRLESFFSARA